MLIFFTYQRPSYNLNVDPKKQKDLSAFFLFKKDELWSSEKTKERGRACRSSKL
jgi:hypothetical protein